MAATLPSSWRRGCAVLVGTGLLALVLLCGTLALSVQQGAVAPRWFDAQIGWVRVVGYSTWNANCPPFTGCDPTTNESYVIWLAIGPSIQTARIVRLVRLPIEH